MRHFLAILWTFELLLHFDQLFFLTYKVGINYASIINRVNYLSENVFCSKDDKIVTDILEKLWNKKKKKITLVIW